jgi:hypothetical protein
MAVKIRCGWIEPLHKLEMLNWKKILLAFDQHELVLVGGFSDGGKELLVNIVEIYSRDCCTKLAILLGN